MYNYIQRLIQWDMYQFDNAQVCSKLKNVCQTCLFDLEYGLPVQVRDKYLAESEKVELPTSAVNKDFFMNQMMTKDGEEVLPYGKATGESQAMLQRLKRKAPSSFDHA